MHHVDIFGNRVPVLLPIWDDPLKHGVDRKSGPDCGGDCGQRVKGCGEVEGCGAECSKPADGGDELRAAKDRKRPCDDRYGSGQYVELARDRIDGLAEPEDVADKRLRGLARLAELFDTGR